jgi:hypothetical protein
LNEQIESFDGNAAARAKLGQELTAEETSARAKLGQELNTAEETLRELVTKTAKEQ